MSKIHTIQQCIREVDPEKEYMVPVPIGTERALVYRRELRGMYAQKTGNGYCTNREIKVWSVFFLLKALTTSGEIQNWRAQREFILQWVQLNEPSFYFYLKQLKQLDLITIDRSFNIRLVSSKKAAAALDIEYTGIKLIPYNPNKFNGKQVFQYFLRAEEFRERVDDQLEGLVYHLDKNPLLRNDLLFLLVHQGANETRLLEDKKYLQERLLKLQISYFKHGSDILEYAFTRRADIHRSAKLIRQDHNYKSESSVSYLKKRMRELKLIQVEKVSVQSKVRSRIYVPDPSKKSGKRDGYKWLRKAMETAWFLCDQITHNYKSIKRNERKDFKKMAS